MARKSDEIREFIVSNVRKYPAIVAHASSHFGLSRQAIQYHVNGLVARNVLYRRGTSTRDRTYRLVTTESESQTIRVTEHLEEDKVFEESIRQHLAGLNNNLVEICYYGFTEMLNNVIDHSLGKEADITLTRTLGDITILIGDDGVGIFRKISEAMGFADHRHALLELSKGKLTTDPDHHSGEGIFFTSRIFDQFTISSGHLDFIHSLQGDDWLFENREDHLQGTLVSMVLSVSAKQTLDELFERFRGESEAGFSKTHVPIRVAQYGDENLVSRSQAKRVLTRFERFGEVWLDFTGVKSIGQGFADQIFRVFAQKNPHIRLIATQVAPQVQRMIDHARASGTPGTGE